MSSKKNIINKELLKSYFEELNHQKHLKILATDTNQVPKQKKIYLNCLSTDKKKPKQNNINTMKNQEPKKKSFSLYKKSVDKNPFNLYKKFSSLSKNKKKRKIVLKCDEMNNKKNQIKLNFFMDYKSSKKILSNGSTRKSSDASPNEVNNHQADIANFKNNYKYCTPNFKLNQKKEHIILKNQNDIQKYTSLKKNIFDLNNPYSKSKEKDDKIKNRNSVPIAINIASSAKQNCFLNYNKIAPPKEKKEEEDIHNSVYEKPMPALKLFDYNVSSSSDSEEEDEEEEEDEKESSDIKYENIGDQRMETELIMDSNFKISDDELSEELNECDAEKEHRKISLIEKKLSNIKNKTEDNHINKIINQPKINSEKIDISCKNMTSRLYLAPNKNQISSLNNNITVSSVITMPGLCDEKEKINQDSYLIKENIFKENFSIYGVFDGHGDNGHLISKYISESMNEYFNNKLNYFLTEEDKENLFTENITNIFLKNYTTILKNTSQKIDEDLNTSITYDISQSGTTSVMLFLLNDQLICSNIGDSQCFIFNCDSEDLWTFEALSFPHLASDEKEQKRILEQGGEIHPYYEQNGIFEGPDRIYAKNKVYPGLVMSRTFGDLEAKKIGVISEPDIIIKKIDSNAKYIVLGSDGLWDVVKPYDVIRIVRPFFNKGDIEGACQTLMKKARQQWDKGEDERDDITFIVVFIGTPNNCIINEKRHSLKKIDEIDNDGK
jgi:serine/threonine protein phosphatase PrpC